MITVALAGSEMARLGAMVSFVRLSVVELELTPSSSERVTTLLPSAPMRLKAFEKSPPEQLAVWGEPEIPDPEITTESPVSQVPVRVKVELIWEFAAGDVVVRTGGRLSTVTRLLGPAALEAFPAESKAVPAATEIVKDPFPVQLDSVRVLEITPEPVTVLVQAKDPDTVLMVTLVAKVALESTEAAAE